MTPSYPKYYQPGAECSWSVLVPPHQRVIVRVLDLQLRSRVSNSRDLRTRDDTCQDQLSVGDTGPLCGELQTDITVVSDNNRIRISYRSGQFRHFRYLDHTIASLLLDRDPSYIIPSRGFLVQLLPGGCTPESPLSTSVSAFLVAYNQSHAAYTCKVGGVTRVSDNELPSHI